MALIVNINGTDINGIDYPFLYIELFSEIELHYDRVSVHLTCYKGIDISGKTYGESILPSDYWVDYINIIKIPYEENIINLNDWVHQKISDYLTADHILMCIYKKYDNDVYDLDEETGDPKTNEETGEPILIFKKNDLVLSKNGVYVTYNKEMESFCDRNQIEII